MSGAIKLSFEFGLSRIAQKRCHRALSKDKLQIKRLLCFETKISRHLDRSPATESERCLVDPQVGPRVEEFALLKLDGRPFRLLESSAVAVNDQVMITGKKLHMHIPELTAGLRRCTPKQIQMSHIEKTDIEFKGRVSLRWRHQFRSGKLATVDVLCGRHTISSLELAALQIFTLPFFCAKL